MTQINPSTIETLQDRITTLRRELFDLSESKRFYVANSDHRPVNDRYIRELNRRIDFVRYAIGKLNERRENLLTWSSN